MDEDVLDVVFELGGPVVRGKGSGVCRRWREVGDSRERWQQWVEWRWWHRCRVEDPRGLYSKRFMAEGRLAKLIYEETVSVEERQRLAVRVTECVESCEEDLREFFIGVGAVAGDEFCRGQLRDPLKATHKLLRPPPTLEELTLKFGLRNIQRSEVANLAASAFIAASSKRSSIFSENDDTMQGLLQVNSFLKVYFDKEGVEKVLDLFAKEATREEDFDSRNHSKIVSCVERVLFLKHKFRGNVTDYYNCENSFVDEVLTRESGIPITLAAVFVAVCERAGVSPNTISLLNCPGHVLLLDHETDSYIDTFIVENDPLPRKFSRTGALIYLSQRNRSLAPEECLLPPRPRLVLLRALRNLIQIYESAWAQPRGQPRGVRIRRPQPALLILALTAYNIVTGAPRHNDTSQLDFVSINRIRAALDFQDDDGVKYLLSLIAADYHRLGVNSNRFQGEGFMDLDLLLDGAKACYYDFQRLSANNNSFL